MMVLGLFGLLGNMLRKPKCVVAYSVAVLVAVPIYFSLAIASGVAPQKIFPSSNCTAQSQHGFGQQMAEVQSLAEASLCQENCPCYFNSQSFDAYNRTYQLFVEGHLPYANYENWVLPSRAGDCPSLQESNEQVRQMTVIQAELNCSGWCQPSGINFFTNLSWVSPSLPGNYSACFDALREQYTYWGNFLAIGNGLICVVMAFDGLFVLCLLLHPERQKKRWYRRLT